MKTEYKLTAYDANQALALINEYLTQGGVGFDDEALERVAVALGFGDRIVILSQEGGAND
jgi:hypothetical protein